MGDIFRTGVFEKISQEDIENNILLPEGYYLSIKKDINECDRFPEDSYHFYIVNIHQQNSADESNIILSFHFTWEHEVETEIYEDGKHMDIHPYEGWYIWESKYVTYLKSQFPNIFVLLNKLIEAYLIV